MNSIRTLHAEFAAANAMTTEKRLRVAASFLFVLLGAPPTSCLAQDARASRLTAAQQEQVITRVISILRDRYVFPEVASRLASSLRAAQETGAFADAADPEQLARALSAHLRDVSQDGHLWVQFQPGEYPDPEREPDPASAESQRRALARTNFGLPRAEILAGNVGYLAIRQFVAPQLGGDAAAAAMRFLEHADALVIDLRESLGGSAGMVAFLASYFVGPEPVHLFDLYNRPRNRTDQHWSQSVLPSRRFLEQPLFILTRSTTFSAGEGFAYMLKRLDRAIIVGETTAGGAHPGRFHRIDERFVMFVAEARVTSPVTDDNWEGRGVTPHVQVVASAALDTAHLLALRRLREIADDPEEVERLDGLIAELLERASGME